jgi:Ca-activated chloride channel family protein
VERRGDDYFIRLQEGSVPADRDFELVWTPEPGQAPRAALFTEDKDGLTYALLMLTPPGTDALEQQTAPRDLSFVIDTSGSMHGDSIEQAREALRFALQGLHPDDRFNIIEFNSEASRLFPGLRPADPGNLAHALAWVERLQADGGTEMAPALKLALPAPSNRRDEAPGRLHQVIFLTDGAVGNEAALLQLIHERLGDSRLFTVAIGSAPNSWFMRKAAEFGRGSFTTIGKPGEVLDKMTALLHRLQYPALTDLRLELPDGISAEVYPDPLPDLYVGEPLQVVLRLPTLPETLVLNGRFGQRPWRSELRLDGPQSGAGISTLWARRRIATLMDELRRGQPAERRAEVREAVVETALAHHLVSKFTSLVAVDKTPARPVDQALQQHPVKTLLPQGWSYGKVFGLAQTATPAQWQGLLGLGLLLAAALAHRLSRRRPGQ